jgi:hypothetical protein
MRARFLACSLAVLFSLAGAERSAEAGPFTLQLVPASGSISGTPGSTIGWGYILTNSSLTDWLVTTAVSADVFQHATPNAFVFDFPILAPGASLLVPYVAGVIGLFEMTWDPTAPIGFVNAGLFVVSAEWWSGDPFGAGQLLGLAPDQSVAYSATVTAPPASVPESSSLIFMTTGFALCWWARWRRRTTAGLQ